jgi:hypothetical protein
MIINHDGVLVDTDVIVCLSPEMYPWMNQMANNDEILTTRDLLLAAEAIGAWLALPKCRDLPEDNEYRAV